MPVELCPIYSFVTLLTGHISLEESGLKLVELEDPLSTKCLGFYHKNT